MQKMLKIHIQKGNNYSLNSSAVSVIPGKFYRFTTKARGLKGEKYSAYFAVIILNKGGKEILRRIRWINDFGKEIKEYTIILQIPEEGDSVILAYRINTELANESEWTGELMSLDDIKFTYIEEKTNEEFDNILDGLRAQAIKHLKDLTKEEEMAIEKNMVWIFGAGRSGSSWLALQLLNHKDIRVWNEPLIGAHMGIFLPVALPMEYDNDKSKHYLLPIQRYVDTYKNEPDYFFSDPFKEIWVSSLKKMILTRLYCQYPESLNKKVVIKEPNGSLGADIISELFPLSKIIALVRDGRDVIDSRLDMYRKDSWAQKWIKLPEISSGHRKWLIMRMSNIWKMSMEITIKAYNQHSPDRRLLVKYEDLRFNTFPTLQNIYKFLGIPVDDEYLYTVVEKYSFEKIPKDEKGEGKVIRKAKPGGWRESFSNEEKEIMNSIMGDMLRELGYEV